MLWSLLLIQGIRFYLKEQCLYIMVGAEGGGNTEVPTCPLSEKAKLPAVEGIASRLHQGGRQLALVKSVEFQAMRDYSFSSRQERH
jgi:hypothetical protein